jgi:hypothetical protein
MMTNTINFTPPYSSFDNQPLTRTAINRLASDPVSLFSAFDSVDPEEALKMLQLLLATAAPTPSFWGCTSIIRGTSIISRAAILQKTQDGGLSAACSTRPFNFSLEELARRVAAIGEAPLLSLPPSTRIRLSLCTNKILTLLQQAKQKIASAPCIIRWLGFLLAWCGGSPLYTYGGIRISTYRALEEIQSYPLTLSREEKSAVCAAIHGSDNLKDADRPNEEEKSELPSNKAATPCKRCSTTSDWSDFRNTETYRFLATQKWEKIPPLFSWKGRYYVSDPCPLAQKKPTEQ